MRDGRIRNAPGRVLCSDSHRRARRPPGIAARIDAPRTACVEWKRFLVGLVEQRRAQRPACGTYDSVPSRRAKAEGPDREHGRHAGDHGRSARDRGDGDRIVRSAYEDIPGREPDTAGRCHYRSRVIDDGWSEEQVRDALRKSPEFREKNTMTRARAEEIVRRAYPSVLDREPDAGSRGYVDRVLRDHWTQPDVERELRKSAEYRKKKGS